MYKNIVFLFILLVLSVSCSNETKNKTEVFLSQEGIEEEMIAAYKEGMKALEEGDALFASKKFDEAEILFPQSVWAPKASLMSTNLYL